MTAFIVLIAVLAAAAFATIAITEWLEEGNRQIEAAMSACLDREAGDWDEPTRAQVEREAHIAEAIRLTEEDEAADAAWAELPIYRATAAYIARFAAEDIDRDWIEMNGGAS